MIPPADNVIGTRSSGEEVSLSLKRMISGSPLPANVRTDVNPYHCLPSSDLTGDIWFLTDSEESKDSKHGSWKAIGDASKIFSDPDISGWITTLEFYQGQAPHCQKTHWLMHHYTITFKADVQDSKAVEVGNLCRLFSGDEQNPNHAKKEKVSSSNPVSENCIQPSNADYITGQGSTFHVDKDAETRKLTVTQRVLNDPPQNQTDDDDYFARGDYMELRDLDTPCSPEYKDAADTRKLTVTRRVLSDPPRDDNYLARGDDYLELHDLDTPLSPSSSESMSSNECFDSLALLQDLESEINQDPLLEVTGCKYNISASLKPNEVVMSPVASGISIGGSNTATEELQKPTTCGHKDGEEARGGYQCEAASSSSFDSGKGRKKTLKKYLCCMPF